MKVNKQDISLKSKSSKRIVDYLTPTDIKEQISGKSKMTICPTWGKRTKKKVKQLILPSQEQVMQQHLLQVQHQNYFATIARTNIT
jgi:hypothetical protein